MAENKVVKGEVIRVLPDDSKPVGAGAVIQAERGAPRGLVGELVAAGHKPEASSAMDEDDRIKMHGCAPPDFHARARALALRPPPRASDRLSPPPSRTPFAFCRPRAGG